MILTKNRITSIKICAAPFVLCLMMTAFQGCNTAPTLPYQDLTHVSKVFGHDKNYRLYLPKGYADGHERYPVIYFFHGWGGRHKSDDNAKLAYDKLGELVDKYKVIMVMWDGNIKEEQPRPYNMGYHNDVVYDVQMKDYFPELVSHIDSVYRTKTDKGHRGIIGFSMGGLMSYYLAGKYPEMISSAVNMTGSPEFFIGTPDNHTLYQLRFTFQNLSDVRLRFHNSTADELTALNDEVKSGAKWSQHPLFEYWQFVGGHVVDKAGETQVFERAMKFVSEGFDHPLPAPDKWSHYDFYKDFTIRNYHVTSNKNRPGFINLANVSRTGFTLSSLRYLPDGPPIDSLEISVTTPPIYGKRKDYTIYSYNKQSGKSETSVVTSDESGRIQLGFDGQVHHVAVIDEETKSPDLIIADYSIGSRRKFLRAGGPNKVILTLMNRGAVLPANSVTSVEFISNDSTLIFERSTTTAKAGSDGRLIMTAPIAVKTTHTPPKDGSPPWPVATIRMSGSGYSASEQLMLPVYFETALADSVTFDDGLKANDSSKVYGRGNADGIVNPGERIMAYYKGHRLRIYADDPQLVSGREEVTDEVLPAKWPDGFTEISVIEIAKNCPGGHVIECLASYETKDFMPIRRHVNWIRIRIPVKR